MYGYVGLGSWSKYPWCRFCVHWSRLDGRALISRFHRTHAKQAVREAATTCPRSLQVDLWPVDLESGVRVTWDVGYPCANFSLRKPLCSRLRPDVRDRQTPDVRRASSLNASAPPYGGGGIINLIEGIYMQQIIIMIHHILCFEFAFRFS